jgi:hypothetical protein
LSRRRQFSVQKVGGRISLACRDIAVKCRHAAGRTLAKCLKNKGEFVILVNDWLTAERNTAIFSACGFAVA